MKLLLAALGGTDRDTVTLATAAALARPFGGHIMACHVRPDMAAMMPMLGGEASGALVADLMRLAEEEANARQARAWASFETWHKSSGIAAATSPGGSEASAEWRQVAGLSNQTLPEVGRFADVMVMARPDPDAGGISVAALEAALFDTGRPVLLAAARPPVSLGAHVAICWNGSTEASRALGAALPILLRARRVSILAVGSHHGSAVEQGNEYGVGELVSYLAWHRIAATLAPSADTSGAAGEALLATAHAISADLLVMGAYGHSRLREMVFGGATRHVIADGSLPALLMH